MKKLVSKAKDYTDIFVFGCGEVGTEIFKKLNSLGLTATIRYCDNNIGARDSGAKVLTPEEAFDQYPDALFVIGSELYHVEMISQLINMGVTDEHMYSELAAKGSRLAVRPFLDRVEYDIVDHCNLNCAGCIHFSNLAEERFADLDDFQVTVRRLVSIMGDVLKGIMLIGGEPLLHPQIEMFITSARNLLPNGNIAITTNGILLKSMPESFWNTCAKCRVAIILSLYASESAYNEIKQLTDKYGVYIETRERRGKGWVKHIIDLNGKQDSVSNFAHCYLNCPQLKNGKISPCGIITSAHHFNKVFEEHLEVAEEDSLDIFSDIDAQDVLDFLAKPAKFCRYCNLKKNHPEKWRMSQKAIHEYVE